MSDLIIGIVGPCSAGKTTLISSLRKNGFMVKHIAQEHSFVPDMWQRFVKPDILIYLDVTFLVSQQRRRQNWTQDDFDEQVERLKHAYQHAHFYLQTDTLSPSEVLKRVLDFLVSCSESPNRK